MNQGVQFPAARRSSDVSGPLISIGAAAIAIGLVMLWLYPYLLNSIHERDAQYPGGRARDYLSGDQYTKMLIEIDYVAGFGPDPQALGRFEQRLNDYVEKTDVRIYQDDSFSLSSARICAETLESLEKEHRDYWTEGDTAVLYILYVSGRCEDDEGLAGGMTYSSTSIGVYKEAISDNILPSQDPDYLEHRTIAEANILLHEFGHVVGLVNELNYEFGYDQEDPDHEYHNRNQTSVMYYQADFTSYHDFDAADVYDLNAIRDLAQPYPTPHPLIIYSLWILIGAGIAVAISGAVLKAMERKRAAFQIPGYPRAYGTPRAVYNIQYQNVCPYCGKSIAYIGVYGRWYCYSCGRYL